MNQQGTLEQALGTSLPQATKPVAQYSNAQLKLAQFRISFYEKEAMDIIKKAYKRNKVLTDEEKNDLRKKILAIENEMKYTAHVHSDKLAGLKTIVEYDGDFTPAIILFQLKKNIEGGKRKSRRKSRKSKKSRKAKRSRRSLRKN